MVPVITTQDRCHQADAFSTICREMKTRLDIYCGLPLEKLDKMALKREMDSIGGFKQ